MSQAKLNVKIINHSQEIEKTIAMAGKLCYSASTIDELEDKLTEENVNKFIAILSSYHHESPMEHVSFTFAVEGVSRALTHQLVRHRIASYSQQSQRYVKLSQFEYIIPKEIENSAEAKKAFIKSMEDSQKAYDEIVEALLEGYCEKEIIDKGYAVNMFEYSRDILKGIDKKKYSELEKKAIENARYVFPNACETKIIVTMNIRTLINFFQHRCCSRAQEEIRGLAFEMLKQCRAVSPILFNNIGATCFMTGKCPEGKMTCGKIQK